MFDLSAWGTVEWVLVGTTAAFFLGPPLILGLAALFLGPGLLARAGRRGNDSKPPDGRGGEVDIK